MYGLIKIEKMSRTVSKSNKKGKKQDDPLLNHIYELNTNVALISKRVDNQNKCIG